MRRFLIRPVVVLLALSVLWPAAALADERKAGVVTALQGQAVVARAVLSEPMPLKFKDDLFLKDRIDTRENSTV